MPIGLGGWFTAQAIGLRLVFSVRLYHPGRNSVGLPDFLVTISPLWGERTKLTEGVIRIAEAGDCTHKNQDRLMNVKSILSRLRSGDVQYVFGRFRAVHISYSRIRRLWETVFRVSAEISAGRRCSPT